MQKINQDITGRCKNGDKDAFKEVVAAYQQMVFSLALKMLCDEDEAKDTTQETFIRVWTNIRRYDEESSLSTWIYTIASHLCLDKIKKRQRIRPLPEDDATLAQYMTTSDPQRCLENKEWISIIKVLAENLSEKQRLVFTLYNLEGLNSSEVEQITGLDARQIKSNLYAARQKIRERLKNKGYE